MVENCIKIPICFEDEDLNHEQHQNSLPSPRIINSREENDEIPRLNSDLEPLFRPLPTLVFYLIHLEEIEHARRIPEELGPHSDFSATSVQDVLPESIDEGLASHFFQPEIDLNAVQILPFTRDLSQFAVVLELLDIQTGDLEKRLQYRRVLKETIERQQMHTGQWSHHINEEINVSRHEERRLHEVLANKIGDIRTHCRARMQELNNCCRDCQALLENFPLRYNTGLERLRRRAEDIERAIQIQNTRVEGEKAVLDRKYEERKTKHGKKKSLCYYEACFEREVKRKFELEKDLRDAFVEFIREIKPTEQEEGVLNIRTIMGEIYIRGEILTEMMHWVDLKEGEDPLKITEKMGFVLGNQQPVRIALTIDRFLAVYRIDRASKEFNFEKQIKVGGVSLRRDAQNLNRMIVKEEKSGILWNRQNEFFVDMGNQVHVDEFMQGFRRYY